MPTLPLYVKVIGGSETTVGIIAGIFGVSSVVARPFFGLQLDMRGRKGILLISLGIIALSTLLYNWMVSVAALLLVRLFHGFAWSATSTAGATMAADIMPPQRRGEGMGYFGIFASLAMAMAPGLGLWIIGTYNFTLLFVVGALLGLVSLSAVIPIRPPELPARSANVEAALFEPTAFAPSAVLFFVTFTYGGAATFISLYALQFHISNIGIYFTVYAAMLVAVRPIAGRLMDKIGHWVVIITGLISLAGAMVLLAFAQNLAWFIAASVFNGIGYGATQPILQAITINRAPLRRRGAANATFLSSFDVGFGAGSLVLGVIADYWGYRATFMVAAAAAVMGLITFFAVKGCPMPVETKTDNI